MGNNGFQELSASSILVSDNLNAAITRESAKNQIVSDNMFLGDVRQFSDQLEVGDTFVFNKGALFLDKNLTKGDKPTANPGTDEYKNQLAAYKPVYFVLIEIVDSVAVGNEPAKPDRVGKICKLYLTSLCKTVREYMRTEDGIIVTTGRKITTSGTVANEVQKHTSFDTAIDVLNNRKIVVSEFNGLRTIKFGIDRKNPPVDDNNAFTIGHTYKFNFVD